MKIGYKIKEFATIESDRIAEFTSAIIPTGLTFIRALIKEILIGKNF